MKLRIVRVIVGAALLLTLAPMTAHAATTPAPGVGMSLAQTSVALPPGESTTIAAHFWTTSSGEVIAKTNAKGGIVSVTPGQAVLGNINTPTAGVVTVNVPLGTPAGTYTTTVGVQVQVASSGGGINLSPGVAMTLKVTVVEHVLLSQTVTPGVIGTIPATGRWGTDSALYTLRNTGNTNATVNFSADSPMVTFMGDGRTVDPAKNLTFRVTVTAPWGTPPGVYPIVITSTVSAFGNSTSQVLPPVMIVVVA